MPEKPKAPRPKGSKEEPQELPAVRDAEPAIESQKPRESEESAEPPAAEQDILEKLHAESDRDNLEGQPENLGKLHQDIERCGCYPIFQQYASGEIPTLERMFQTIKPLVAEMDAEIQNERVRVAQGQDDSILKHLEKNRGLLLGRESQIRGSIQRYVNNVIRFNRLKKLSAGGARDMLKQFEQTDHQRRRAHNDLISSLRTYVEVIESLWEEGADDKLFSEFKFTEWRMGEDARQRDPSGTRNLVFGKNVLEDRDFIRDWAIVADFHTQLSKLGDEEWLKSQNKNGDRKDPRES